MKRAARIGVGRMLLVLLLAFVAGVQVSLYLWDVYDDRVADPWSAAIGAAFLLAAGVTGLRPFRRR